MNKRSNSLILKLQKKEITEHYIYKKLAKKIKDKNNKIVLEHMSIDGLSHYKYWKSVSKKNVKPNEFKISLYMLLSAIFGLSFSLKLMEKRRRESSNVYRELRGKYKRVAKIIKDEQRHEKKILDMLSEERVEYAGSIVLGLNDAIVELTGALAGLTLAFHNTIFVGITGLIVGIAASLSMAASGYLSSAEENNKNKKPKKSALYTGIAYIVTVLFLVSPYFILKDLYMALFSMLGISILIILMYTFYVSTAKGLNFWKKFLQMVSISLTVAIISFFVGHLLRRFIGIDIQ